MIVFIRFFKQYHHTPYDVLTTRKRRHNEKMGLTFVDANAVVTVCEGDGIHWDVDNHKEFGEYLATFI